MLIAHVSPLEYPADAHAFWTDKVGRLPLAGDPRCICKERMHQRASNGFWTLQKYNPGK
jgi:hypothetical protein